MDVIHFTHGWAHRDWNLRLFQHDIELCYLLALLLIDRCHCATELRTPHPQSLLLMKKESRLS